MWLDKFWTKRGVILNCSPLPLKGVSWMVCRYPIRENEKKITKFRKKTCFLHFSAIGFYFRSKKWNTNLSMSITVWFWCFFNTISSKLVFLSFLCNRILFPSKKMDIKFVKDRTKVITKWKAKLSFHEKKLENMCWFELWKIFWNSRNHIRRTPRRLNLWGSIQRMEIQT